MTEVSDLLLGAGFNLAVALVIVRFIYYPLSPNRDFAFTYLAFNTVIFFVMSMLTSVELSVGVGFGLFAIFSVLNYRTEELPIREMTYLFTIIALPVMNSVFSTDDNFARLAIANGFVIAMLFVLEHEWGFKFESNKRITYEKIDLIRPENEELMLEDLRLRCGLNVKRFEVNRIDFLRDTAEIRVYYDEDRNGVVGGAHRRWLGTPSNNGSVHEVTAS